MIKDIIPDSYLNINSYQNNINLIIIALFILWD